MVAMPERCGKGGASLSKTPFCISIGQKTCSPNPIGPCPIQTFLIMGIHNERRGRQILARKLRFLGLAHEMGSKSTFWEQIHFLNV